MRAIGVLALGLSLSAAATAATGGPSLRVVDLRPFSVHGARFDAGERLRIVIRTKRRVVRRVVTTPAGTFTIRLRHVSVRRCGHYSVLAYGAHGLLAATKSSAQSCGAPRQPVLR